MRRLVRVNEGTASPLGPLEASVMGELWRRGGWSSVTDLMPAFRSKLAYSTIKTILNNLADKGHVKKRSAGRANEFSAASTRAAFEDRIVADLVKPLVTQYRTPLLAHIVDQLDDDGDLLELERMLRKKRRERAGG